METHQYHLAAISKPILVWDFAFLLLRPDKEHACCSLIAKAQELATSGRGAHPCLTAALMGLISRSDGPEYLSLASLTSKLSQSA